MTSPRDTVTVLRIFLASPGDVGEERKFVRELLESRLPNDPWLHHAVAFKLIAWDHPYGGTPMVATMTPQQAVTEYTGRPADCDIVIIILWSRLGSHLDVTAHPRPGGGRYESGTEWEYEDALSSARHPPDVMVFHKSEKVSVDPDLSDADERMRQRRLVTQFLSRFKSPDGAFIGGYTPYPDLATFKILVENHLKHIVTKRVAAQAPTPDPIAHDKTTDPPEGIPIPVPARCFGRSEDTASIVDALTAATDPTAVLVEGPGGIGKTTLTQEAANHPSVVARFGQRRWFAELETATDRDTFDARLLLALGLDPTHGFAAATHRLAQAPALLVLDNLETPWEGAGLAIEARLATLAAIPDLAVLASFRGQEAVGGVRWTRHHVDPLPQPEARVLFLDISGSILGDDPDLPALLEALGGVPLAIGLTARRAAHHADLVGLWAEWQRIGLDVATPPGTSPGRLTSVTHSIALSLRRSNRLNPDGHRLFALLGQCPAGLAPRDRTALLGDAAFAAEDGLVAVGLAYHHGPRLDLLPPVRDYARRRCLPATDDAARWCRHFLDRARTEGERIFLDGGADALADLTPEITNIDASLRAAPGLSLRQPAVEALGGVYRLLSASGAGSPAALDALARVCAEAADTAGEAACHYSRGRVAQDRSDHDTARARYEEALPLFRSIGNVLGEANCIASLGDIALRRADHDMARARYEEALPLFRSIGNVRGEANCIRSLGDIALRRADHDMARARYEEALPLFRQIDAVLGGASCIKGLGDIALDRSDYDTARVHYEEALPLYRRVGAVLGEANCIRRLGDIAVARSDHNTAWACYEQALPRYRRVGDVVGEANSTLGKGNLSLAKGDKAEAKRHFHVALAMYERVGRIDNIALSHERLAQVTRGAERSAHVQAAREAWLSMNLLAEAERVALRFA